MTRIIIAASTALAALCAPAQADTKFSQISPSIILLGEPAPAAVEQSAVEESEFRQDMPDVLADGKRREAGVAAVEEPPVAEDETTSSIGASPDDAGDAPPFAPLEDTELRRGS